MLGNILAAIGTKVATSIFDKVLDKGGDRVSDSVVNGVFGPEDRVSQGDYDHYQSLLNSSADDEALRDATRHNSFANNTMREDLARYGESQPFLRGVDREQNTLDSQARASSDKAYMDEVYAGTSNWERLGSSAAPSLAMSGPSKPNSGRPQESGFLGQLTPIISAKMQNETQESVAKTSQRTAESVAQIQGQTARDVASINTAGGTLPEQQKLESASRVLLQQAQTWQAEATAGKTQVETAAVRQKMQIDAIASFLSASPTEIIDLGLLKYTHKPGWKSIISVLTKAGNDQTRQQDLAQALANVPDSDFTGIKRDVIELAAMAGKGAQALKGFLPNIRRSTHQKRKNKWQRPDGTYVD